MSGISEKSYGMKNLYGTLSVVLWYSYHTIKWYLAHTKFDVFYV